MSSRILPGRKNDPLMRYKAILQQSLAFSRIFNSRNIEFYWYPVWGQALFDLVAEVPNLIVAPQFPVWFVPEDNREVEGDDSLVEVEIQDPNTEGAIHGRDDEFGDHEGQELELSLRRRSQKTMRSLPLSTLLSSMSMGSLMDGKRVVMESGRLPKQMSAFW